MSENLLGSIMPSDVKQNLIKSASDSDIETIFF